MWLFNGCGSRDLVPLVGSLSVLVTVRVYAGGPSAVVFLLGYFLVVWFVAFLCGIILYNATTTYYYFNLSLQT
jgi:hypothetical protein